MITATYKGKYYDVEYSIVNVSELERELRIDAEYYEPFYLRNEEKITRKKWEYLINKSRVITDGSHEVRKYVEKGIIFLRVQDIFENYIEIQEKVYISEEENEKQKRSEPRKYKDILITKTGKIGVATVFHLDERANIPADIAILKNNSNLNSFYISTFINTFHGKISMQRQMSGLGRPRLVLESFKYIKIPIPSDTFQKFIEKIVLKAYEERQKAEQLYKQAEEILLEELGLKNWKPKIKKIKIGGQVFEEEENISIRILSEVIKTDRMDAEYWEPKYDEIENIVKNYRFGFKYIRDVLIDDIKNGTTPKSLLKFYDKTKYPFVRIDAFGSYLDIKENNLYSIDKTTLQKLSYCNVKKDDVLVSMTGTIGESVIYTLNEEGAINQNIVRLRVNSNYINPETLALFIKSIGRYLLNKLQTGNVQPYVNTINFSKLIVPLINPQTQQKISYLIQQSFKARENSKKLLEIAKRTVEIYIEEDKEEGIKLC